jgi:hypothetical protein
MSWGLWPFSTGSSTTALADAPLSAKSSCGSDGVVLIDSKGEDSKSVPSSPTALTDATPVPLAPANLPPAPAVSLAVPHTDVPAVCAKHGDPMLQLHFHLGGTVHDEKLFARYRFPKRQADKSPHSVGVRVWEDNNALTAIYCVARRCLTEIDQGAALLRDFEHALWRKTVAEGKLPLLGRPSEQGLHEKTDEPLAAVAEAEADVDQARRLLQKSNASLQTDVEILGLYRPYLWHVLNQQLRDLRPGSWVWRPVAAIGARRAVRRRQIKSIAHHGGGDAGVILEPVAEIAGKDAIDGGPRDTYVSCLLRYGAESSNLEGISFLPSPENSEQERTLIRAALNIEHSLWFIY